MTHISLAEVAPLITNPPLRIRTPEQLLCSSYSGNYLFKLLLTSADEYWPRAKRRDVVQKF